MLLQNKSKGIVSMIANNTSQQYIENDWGYYVETFADTTITTSALTIWINEKSVSVSRLS